MQSIEGIKKVSVIEPTIQINTEKNIAVFKGGQDNIYYEYAANSYSLSQAIWNINVPSEGIFLDRKMYIRARVRFTFTGTTPNVNQFLLQSGRDAPRAFPLSNSMQTLTVGINNSATSINLADVIQALMRYHPMQEFDYELSNSPCIQDQSQYYLDLQDSSRNPLNGFLDSSYGEALPRGAHPFEIITNTGGNGAQAVVEAEFCEPLMISPLHWNKSFANGFFGVNKLNFNIVWNTSLGAKMWSHMPGLSVGGSDILTTQVEFLAAPEILIRSITPSEVVSMELPRHSLYPYHQIQQYITDFPEIAPYGEDQRTINSVQLSSIPRRIFLFLRRQSGTETITDTDSFLAIDNISINFANRSGLLASASQRDLYNISKKNGCQLSWAEWSGQEMSVISGSSIRTVRGIGSVLCLYIPEDIPLSNSDSLAPGVNEKVNLQIRVTYRNLLNEAIFPQCVLVTDDEGVFSIYDNMSMFQIGMLSKMDVLDTPYVAGVSYDDVMQDVYGGDFFSSIGSFLKKIPQGIKQGLDFYKENIAPVVDTVKTFAPLVGLGEQPKYRGGLLVGGMQTGGRLLEGGKRLTRDELKAKLRR